VARKRRDVPVQSHLLFHVVLMTVSIIIVWHQQQHHRPRIFDQETQTRTRHKNFPDGEPAQKKISPLERGTGNARRAHITTATHSPITLYC